MSAKRLDYKEHFEIKMLIKNAGRVGKQGCVISMPLLPTPGVGKLFMLEGRINLAVIK
jgi:hypothetical protein